MATYETCPKGHRFAMENWAGTKSASARCPWCVIEAHDGDRAAAEAAQEEEG